LTSEIVDVLVVVLAWNKFPLTALYGSPC
jgi:hypothetical protein